MTINIVFTDLKLFFSSLGICLCFYGSSVGATQNTKIYSFKEIQEFRSEALQKTYLGQLIQKKQKNPESKVNVEQVTQEVLGTLKKNILQFKKKNPRWTEADELMVQLNSPKSLEHLQEKMHQIIIHTLMNSLDRDGESYRDVYYVIPRLILDFRHKLSNSLNKLDPKIKDDLLKKLNRYVFKDQHKEGYLKELQKRYKINFSSPQSGDSTLLGHLYAPGSTYYSQSYMVLANFSLLDAPLSSRSSVLLRFFTQTSDFKEPFGLIVRDLKRIFPRELDSFRQEIQKRLMNLQGTLDSKARFYLIQQFIPQQDLGTLSHLEFFGHGFPIYQDTQGALKYRPGNQPIYWEGFDLTSPEAYRKSFVEKDGNPERFHKIQGLLQPKDLNAPVYALRLYFDPVRFPEYVAYAFSAADLNPYEVDLQIIVDDIVKKLSSIPNKAEKDDPLSPRKEPQDKKKKGLSEALTKGINTVTGLQNKVIQKGQSQVGKLINKLVG